MKNLSKNAIKLMAKSRIYDHLNSEAMLTYISDAIEREITLTEENRMPEGRRYRVTHDEKLAIEREIETISESLRSKLAKEFNNANDSALAEYKERTTKRGRTKRVSW